MKKIEKRKHVKKVVVPEVFPARQGETINVIPPAPYEPERGPMSIDWLALRIGIEWRYSQSVEWVAKTIAWALPRRVVYWAFIRMSMSRLDPHQEVPAQSVVDVLKRHNDWTTP